MASLILTDLSLIYRDNHLLPIDGWILQANDGSTWSSNQQNFLFSLKLEPSFNKDHTPCHGSGSLERRTMRTLR